jgi:Xaa-Pro aminopeptidase
LNELLPKSVAVVDVTHQVRTARAVKSAWELRWVQAAALQVRETMQNVALFIEPGMTEVDVFRSAESELRKAGHQGVMRMRRPGAEMFFGQVCAGPNAALPAYLDAPLGGSGMYPAVGKGASLRPIERGELLVLDLMGACNGYLSDCTRVVAVGGIESQSVDLLDAQSWCCNVLETVAAGARPGVAPSALYAHALELADEGGYADKFMGAAPDQARFVGHGIGLEVDEYPFLARGYDDPLQAGMVFALEPKLVFPGRAAVGIEDAFIVTNDGVEALAAVPRAVLAGAPTS